MDIDKDFSRNVWCVLGLPFDALTREQSANEIISAVQARRPYFLSTPNLNFLCAAQADKMFRESVINSDLSIVDGFPIVVVAKLLGIPIPERVGGSNLIEHLYQRNTTTPIRVFFFGGESDAGALASQKINQQPAGLLAVGHFDPGFGSVEEMSSPDIIDKLNAHDVEFLFVSIGAKKGQPWIINNRQRLNIPVVGYLGAVINFFAGTVKRAPDLIQNTGLEWLWRIYQEPTLWKRYYDDGICFLGLLSCNVIPYWFWLTFMQPKSSKQTILIDLLPETKSINRIVLTGYCTAVTLAALRNTFKSVASEKSDVIVDLKNVALVDSAFLGLCLVLYKHLNASGRSLKLVNPNKAVRRIMAWQRVDDLLA